VVYVPFSNAIKSDKPVKKELIDVLAVLSIWLEPQR
jgi:6-phosphofructokinase 1